MPEVRVYLTDKQHTDIQHMLQARYGGSVPKTALQLFIREAVGNYITRQYQPIIFESATPAVDNGNTLGYNDRADTKHSNTDRPHVP
jgi:adenine-specific DNA glycosylase